jgi:hypothetical protein
VLEQRDWALHPTVLSGDLAGDDGPDFAGSAENSYHVVTAIHADATAVLDGFIVRGGHADGDALGPVPASNDQGSALNVFFATPHIEHVVFAGNFSAGHGAVNDNSGATFIDCSFRANNAVDFAAGLYIGVGAATRVIDCQFIQNVTAGKGAGVYCQSTASVELTQCAFTRNAATSGGGMFNALDAHPRVDHCSFEGNTAFVGGGGVYDDGASPIVVDCLFEHNDAGVDVTTGGGGAGGSGGGGLWNSGGHGRVENCAFHDNAASFGGGVYNNNFSTATFAGCEFDHNHAHEAGGLYTLNSDVLVTRCAFLRNDASGGDFSVGGGVSTYYSNSIVEGCTFRANHAELGGGGEYNEGQSPIVEGCVFAQNSTDGADEGWGGGVLNGYFCSPLIANCTFVGNAAHRGGGIFDFVFSAASIVNCTLTANVSSTGGALHDFDGSQTSIANCIVWGNEPAEMSGAPSRVTYSCIRGGYTGAGNIGADPQFRRAPSAGPDGVWGTGDDDCGDLRLAGASPCIDAGDDADVPGWIGTDLDGNPRFQDDPRVRDTGHGRAPIVDMGAFEF